MHGTSQQGWENFQKMILRGKIFQDDELRWREVCPKTTVHCNPLLARPSADREGPWRESSWQDGEETRRRINIDKLFPW